MAYKRRAQSELHTIVQAVPSAILPVKPLIIDRQDRCALLSPPPSESLEWLDRVTTWSSPKRGNVSCRTRPMFERMTPRTVESVFHNAHSLRIWPGYCCRYWGSSSSLRHLYDQSIQAHRASSSKLTLSPVLGLGPICAFDAESRHHCLDRSTWLNTRDRTSLEFDARRSP